MKNMYANVCKAVKAGAVKIFVVGYMDGKTCVFTEADTIAEAKIFKARMVSEGHKPFIDVYTR